MKPFKVGDTVYSTKNSVWGMHPMKVVRVDVVHNGCSCSVNSLGVGYFTNNELTHPTKTRIKKLDAIHKAERKVKNLKSKLFKDPNGWA